MNLIQSHDNTKHFLLEHSENMEIDNGHVSTNMNRFVSQKNLSDIQDKNEKGKQNTYHHNESFLDVKPHSLNNTHSDIPEHSEDPCYANTAQIKELKMMLNAALDAGTIYSSFSRSFILKGKD